MRFRGKFRIPFDRRTLLVTLTLCLCLPIAANTGPVPTPSPETRKLIKKATNLMRSGLNAEAEALLRKAVERDPQSVEAKTELAFALVKERQLRAGYEICFAAAQKDPKNARTLSVLGATLLSAGRFPEARSFFNASLAYDRRQDLAWAGLGMLDFYENKIASSLANLENAVYWNSEEPDYLFGYAQVASRSEHYKEAAAAYERFLAVSKSTDTDRRERIKGLIQFLTYLGNRSGIYVMGGADQTSVPFELEGNRPVITLRVNGNTEPLRFVLDTGSGISVLSEETAKKLKIKPVARGGYGRGLGGDGKFEIVYAHLRSMQIGDVEMRSVPVYVRRFHDPGSRIDGYIGLALISKFLTTIDYGNQTFSLTRRATDRANFLSSNEISIPLRLTSSGFLSGEVQIQGIETPLSFIVDTGATVSVISDVVSKTEGISRYINNNETLRVIGSAGITDDMPTFLLPKISFGDHSIESVKAVALNLDTINEASGFEQAGILGGNFLKNYRLTFDFKNSKVTFVSVNPPKE